MFGEPNHDTPRPRSSPQWWTVEGGAIAKVCPACGCGKDSPCNVHRGGGRFEVCVPAGLFGRRLCSACREQEPETA